MSYDWGPHYLVPTSVIKSYSGLIQLRETYDEVLLNKELESLGLSGNIIKVSNPWYCRLKDTKTWLKIGESENKSENFPVSWDTRTFKNGVYEVLGLMHVQVLTDNGTKTIAGQNTVQVIINN